MRRRASPRRLRAPRALVARAPVLVAFALALAAAAGPRQAAPGAREPRFAAVDVVVDTGGVPLAAWQVELVDRAGRARWTAVEGGDAPAFADPPRHDPRALARGRIVLAALSLDDALPTDATRVATVHYAVEGAGEPDLAVRLVAVGDRDGRPIGGRATLR